MTKRPTAFDFLGLIFTTFSRSPWWIILPISGFILYLQWIYLLNPSFKKREWSVPSTERLESATGKFQYRANSRAPYPFIDDDGQHINIYCVPYISRAFQDCVESGGIRYNILIGQKLTIQYFDAIDTRDTKHILVSISNNTGSIVPAHFQIRSLEIIASMEDENLQFSPYIGIALYIATAVILMSAIGQKISLSLKSLSRGK